MSAVVRLAPWSQIARGTRQNRFMTSWPTAWGTPVAWSLAGLTVLSWRRRWCCSGWTCG